jgi:hypothetical protein
VKPEAFLWQLLVTSRNDDFGKLGLTGGQGKLCSASRKRSKSLFFIINVLMGVDEIPEYKDRPAFFHNNLRS